MKSCLRFLFLLLLILSGVPNVFAQGTEFSVLGFWNTNLEQINVAECSKLGGVTSNVTLTLKDNTGVVRGSTARSLAGYGTAHFVLNSLGGAELLNKYGTYEIRSAAPLYCHTAVYRLNQRNNRIKPIQYAYSMPTSTSLSGSTFGLFNSRNPEGGEQQVYNWLSLVNLGNDLFKATVTLYDLSGSELSQFDSGDILPGQRLDYPLGHDRGQILGMYRITPVSEQPYSAFSIRYGQKGSGFNFAFPVQAHNPNCDPGAVPATTMGNQFNYGEVGNINNETREFIAEVRDQTGALLHSEIFTLAANEQRHLPLHSWLGANNLGSLRVRCSGSQSGGVFVQSLFYGHATANDPEVEWAYASQGLGRRIERGEIVASAINTFFGARNWNKYHDQSGNDSTLSLDIYSELGERVASDYRVLAGSGSVDYPLHQHLADDRVGLGIARAEQEGVQYNSEQLRVIYRSDGNIGYIFNLLGAVVDPNEDGDGGSSSSLHSSSSLSSSSTNSSIVGSSSSSSSSGPSSSASSSSSSNRSSSSSSISSSSSSSLSSGSSSSGSSSSYSPPVYINECNDGLDNDGDGLIDAQDDGGSRGADGGCLLVNGQESEINRGYTLFRRSADTRVIFVSSTLGSDSNSGLSPSAAKRTINAGLALLRDGYPDWLLLRRGDVWVNERLGYWVKSGRSLNEPMLVGSYGSNPERPLLQTGVQIGLSTEYGPNENYAMHDLAFTGLELVAHQRDGTQGVVGMTFLMPVTNLLIEDMKIVGYSSGLNLQGTTNSAGRGINNARLRRCVIVDSFSSVSHSQGTFWSGVHGGLIEENVFDHNGWHEQLATPTIFNHNLYVTNGTTNIVVRGNIISDAASHGLQLRSGGEIRENLFYKNALGLLLGGGDTVDPGGVTGSVIDNLILDGKDIAPNLPRGFGIDLKNIATATVRRNIVANKLTNTSAFAIGSAVSGGPNGVGVNNTEIVENYILNWRGPFLFYPVSLPATYSGNVFARNTVIDLQSGNSLVSTPALNGANIAFQDNRFWSAHTTQAFSYAGGAYDLTGWRQRSQDVGSTFSQATIDPGLGLSQYTVQAGLGESATDFIARAREQSKFNWNQALQPSNVFLYFLARLD